MSTELVVAQTHLVKPWAATDLQKVMSCRRGPLVTYAAKELHFNRSGEALKRMQAGVDKLASVVGVTLGPKVRFVVQPVTFHCRLDYQRCARPQNVAQQQAIIDRQPAQRISYSRDVRSILNCS